MAAQRLHSMFGDQLQVVAISTSACTDKSDPSGTPLFAVRGSTAVFYLCSKIKTRLLSALCSRPEIVTLLLCSNYVTICGRISLFLFKMCEILALL